jgi:hypothetical protein
MTNADFREVHSLLFSKNSTALEGVFAAEFRFRFISKHQ